MNEERNLDNLIKSGLKEKVKALKIERTDNCPSEIELSDYLQGLLPKAKEESIAEHVRCCYWCIEQLDQAQRAASASGIKEKRRPLGAIAKNLINWLKKNRWLVGSGVMFTLSFIFHRYFLQFLILTLLMGIKWIFTTGGAKTVIMIYEAWKKSREDSHSRIKDRF